MRDIGIIVIGRNEGERLRRCLESVVGRAMSVVYVDSGSTDGSVQLARSMGADVVELDPSRPFSAARARNAGAERLATSSPELRFVQFVDGDCELRDGWIDRAASELNSRHAVAIVCGRRRERFPDASIYNGLADLEWDTPTGLAQSCGGDAMVRLDAFRDVGGFDPTIVAGEEPELCQRLRQQKWKILRIDAEMTWHDAAILRFSQWWNRQIRSGYGATDVCMRFGQSRDNPFGRQVRSAQFWTIGFVALVIFGTFAGFIAGSALTGRRHDFSFAVLGAVAAIAIWPLQIVRLTIANYRRAHSLKIASGFAVLTMIAKWSFLVGRRRYFRDRRTGRLTRQIEYKAAGAALPIA